MRIKGTFFIILFYLLTLCSCIRESLSECVTPSDGGVALRYDYLLNMEYRDLFGERVADLKVFFFDRDSVLCDTLLPAVGEGELQGGWMRRVELVPGEYTIVTWAGEKGFGHSFGLVDRRDGKGVVVGQTRLADFVAQLKCEASPLDETVWVPSQSRFGALYHGIQRAVVEAGEWTVVATSLVRDTKVLRVKVGKLSQLAAVVPDAADFEIRLAGRNGQYKYDNTADGGAPWVSYRAEEVTIANDTAVGDITTMRLLRFGTGDPYGAPLLTVVYKPTNQIICEGLDVSGLILKARIPARDSQGQIVKDEEGNPEMVLPTTEYLDRQDLFEIVFGITDDDGRLSFTVWVNGWEIQNIVPVP